MHWLVAISTDKMYFISPWTFEALSVVNLNCTFRSQLDLNLDQHHLILSNLKPKSYIKKKSLSISSHSKAAFHLYKI